MNIFLQGQKFVGKTTLIHKVVGNSKLKATGFVSIKLISTSGESLGFYLERYTTDMPLFLTVGKDKIDKERIFISGDMDNRKINLEVFKNIEDIVSGYHGYDVFVMDEIGGIDMLVHEFVDYIYKVFESKLLCMGVIKSEANLSLMSKKIKLPLDEKIQNTLRDDILNKYNSKIITLTNNNIQATEIELRNNLGGTL